MPLYEQLVATPVLHFGFVIGNRKEKELG